MNVMVMMELIIAMMMVDMIMIMTMMMVNMILIDNVDDYDDFK